MTTEQTLNAWQEAVRTTDLARAAEGTAYTRAINDYTPTRAASHAAWQDAVTATDLARAAETAAFESWLYA